MTKVYRYQRRTADILEREFGAQFISWDRRVVLKRRDMYFAMDVEEFSELPSELHGLSWGVFAKTLRLPEWAARQLYVQTCAA